MRFKDKVALITGAGSGIGLATARRLTEEGARVITGIFQDDQRPAVADFDAVLLDVTDEGAWGRALAHVQEAHGGLDVLVNNAGISRTSTAEETDRELWDRVLDVKLRGTFLGCKAAIPMLRARGGGAIVNVASINAIRGNHRLVAYSASKGGVVGVTLAMALDYAEHNIRVNCVCPAAIEGTRMMQRALDAAEDADKMRRYLLAKHPMGRCGRPEEVAYAILFLASDEASFVTGVTLPIDGGRSIR